MSGIPDDGGSGPQHSTLIFVRHGETVWNTEGRWQGWLDSPLTERGRRQAERAARRLANMAIDHAYCSDAGRAVETARILLEPHGLTATPVEHLRERYYGAHEGLDAGEIAARHPGTRFADSGMSRELWRPPGGETMAEVRARVVAHVVQAAAAHPGRTILNVTHSGVVRIMDSVCQGRPLEELWERHPPNLCVLIARVADGRCEMIQDFMPNKSIAARK